MSEYPEEKPSADNAPAGAQVLWFHRWPLCYLRHRHDDPPLKWAGILIGWLILAAGVAQFVAAAHFASLADLSLGLSECALAAAFLMQPRIARHSYRRGWVEGRGIVRAEIEAARAGQLSLEEFAALESTIAQTYMSWGIENP